MTRDVTGKMRLNHEPPAVTAKLGWRYHHIGIPHTQPRAQIAFAVDDLDEALKGREILIAPTEPSAGVRVAFILDDGAPIELLQFYRTKAVRPKTRHAAEQGAAPDDGARAKGKRRRR